VTKPYHFLKDPPDLANRDARLVLQPRIPAYWNYLIPGVALGYRRGVRTSLWVLRHRERPTDGRGKYRYKTFAFADDFDPADGDEVLSYEQARARALEIFVQARFDGPKSGKHGDIYKLFDDLPPDPPYTLAHALRDFLNFRKSSGYHVQADFYNSRTYVLPNLGSLPIEAVTRAKVWECVTGIVESTVRVQTAFGGRHRVKGKPRSADELRRRQIIANHVLGTIGRTLDYAYTTGKLDTDFVWQHIPKFRAASVPRDRHLSQAEISALFLCCDPDLKIFVQAALFTGCRFSELQNLRVRDVELRIGHLRIEKTKTRRPRAISLTPRARAFFERICSGKDPDDMVLAPKGRDRWGWPVASTRLTNAAKRANLKPPVNWNVMRHTYASQAVMAGIPLNVVAKQLGHATTRTLERHYAHLSDDYVQEIVRSKMPDLA
jgi:integrase